MVEVELKARIEDLEAAELRVASFARFLRRVDKSDSYWHGPGWRESRGERGFRVRTEDGVCTVTFKTKRMAGGIEVSKEREFRISDAAAFEELALRIGCEPYYRKRKAGAAYGYGGMTLEILRVDGAGDFLEIERLLPEEGPEALDEARAGLLGALALAGVPESAIEDRTYAELILDLGRPVPR